MPLVKAASQASRIPRALTVDELHQPGNEWLRDLKVYLDGLDVTNQCTAYDMDAGCVTVLAKDRQGRLIWAGEFAAYDVLYGRVEVVV